MLNALTSAWASVQASSSRIVARVPAAARAASTAAVPSAPRAGAHLGDLAPAKGSKQVHQRYGRGIGSTKGGTAGRGHKGQKARSGNGKPVPGYEGGQTPLHRLIPKRGFVNFTSRVYAPLALSKIQSLISTARISPSEPITIGSLVRSNAVHGLSNSYSGIKILGPADPSLPLPPLRIEASRFSKSAAEAVIAAGGSVSAVYKNRLALQAEIHPWKAPAGMTREAEPIGKRDIEYYSNPKKHGYLAQRKAAMEGAGAQPAEVTA